MIFGGRSFHVESNRAESHIIDLHLCSPDMYKDMVEGRVSSAPYQLVSSNSLQMSGVLVLPCLV